MATVVICAYNVVDSPGIGGHFWVYLQYAHALQRLGCDVYWLECVRRDASDAAIATFLRRAARFGLGGRTILYALDDAGGEVAPEFIGVDAGAAEAVFSRADLLLNFHYAIDAAVLARFKRTALVDIDPGLLQYWISRGQLRVAPHDRYLTIGETVGTPGAAVPDCGLPWIRIRPPVCLDLWPYRHDPACSRFTTVSSWLAGEYVTAGRGETKRILFENDKRVSFMQYADLPALAPAELELALHLAGTLDAPDRRQLERSGWRIRHALEVAASPERYRAYIQASRGEFSCVKPSCLYFRNAWVSDRTLCYLASGKPVVVQDTGPSAFLPDGDGMFRFSTLEQAADALAAINAGYERHCVAARTIAESFFDAEVVLSDVLNASLRKSSADYGCGRVRPGLT